MLRRIGALRNENNIHYLELTAMKLKAILLLLSSVLFASSASAQVPEHFQQIILENVPQTDANGDGKVTVEEIKKIYPSLPAPYQRVVRKRLPEIAGDAPVSRKKQTAKPVFDFDRPAGDSKTGREKGYNCLFMGHSFFCPIVRQIDEHATNLGLKHHQQFVAMSGGASGSPGMLWTSEKPAVLHGKKLLESGKVELLALTGHYRGSTLEDYRRWVELAVKHNPKTIIVIQSPWVIKNKKELAEYSEEVAEATNTSHEGIDRLREEFPHTTFLCVPQGQWMVELWRLFEADKLPELTQFVGGGKGESQQALFRDNFGHGGELAEKQGALLWLRVIYGVELTDYEFSTKTKYDLKELAQRICDRDPYCKVENK